MSIHTYKILLHKEDEGEYTVTVPALPGCVTYGDNIDHAIDMAKEAIELYIEELQSRGEEIPDDSHTLEYSLNLTVWTDLQRISLKFLKKSALFYKRSKGSHQIFYNPGTSKTFVVPMHGNKDLPKGTYFAILKQAGIDINNL